MHTLETSVIMPALLVFITVMLCLSLYDTDMVSQHADELKTSVPTEIINHTDVVRGGVVLEELFDKYEG